MGHLFYALAASCRTRSPSDTSYMAPVWAKVKKSGFNSIVAAVGWDQLEPSEGTSDFAIVDDLLDRARSAGVRLVLIWFGAFKNASSTYAPTWVRADPMRFRARRPRKSPLPTPFTYDGSMPRPTLSVFSSALRAADETAYAALMATSHPWTGAHIDPRPSGERSGPAGREPRLLAAAIAAWNSPIPPELARAVARDPAEFPRRIVTLFAEPAPETHPGQIRFGNEIAVADEVFMASGVW